jgi:hypothetical protein
MEDNDPVVNAIRMTLHEMREKLTEDFKLILEELQKTCSQITNQVDKLNSSDTVCATDQNSEQNSKLTCRRVYIDVCVNKCIIYDEEFRMDIFCPFCFAYRYTPCTFNDCKEGQDCNPSVNAIHKRHKRKANKRGLFFRPLVKRINDTI